MLHSLIPGADVAPSTDTFAIDQKKGAWTPPHTHLRTRSFPTPFAQAEMMSHVLGLLSLDPGARQPEPETLNPRLQQSFERWRLMLLALVLGEVTLETVDLRRPEVDNFGAMLADLRPECRFFGLLRDARRPGMEGRKLLVGATDPQCLLWCAPRAARENYWSELKTRIDASADRAEALKLLADWRASLDRAGVWQPGHESRAPVDEGPRGAPRRPRATLRRAPHRRALRGPRAPQGGAPRGRRRRRDHRLSARARARVGRALRRAALLSARAPRGRHRRPPRPQRPRRGHRAHGPARREQRVGPRARSRGRRRARAPRASNSSRASGGWRAPPTRRADTVRPTGSKTTPTRRATARWCSTRSWPPRRARTSARRSPRPTCRPRRSSTPTRCAWCSVRPRPPTAPTCASTCRARSPTASRRERPRRRPASRWRSGSPGPPSPASSRCPAERRR